MTIKQALITPEELFVKDTGTNRSEANKDKHDRPDYDYNRFNLTSLQANRLGVYAEAGTFKWTGGNILRHDLSVWPSFVPNDHPDYHALLSQADLYGRIEVRRANSLWSPIPSFGKDRDLDAIIIQTWVPYAQAMPTADNPFPGIRPRGYVELLGWCYARDKGTVPSWNKTDALVHNRRPMHTLDLSTVLGGIV